MIHDLLEGREAQGGSRHLVWSFSPAALLKVTVTSGPRLTESASVWLTGTPGDSHTHESVRCSGLG